MECLWGGLTAAFRLAGLINPWLILGTVVTLAVRGIVMSFLVRLPEETYRDDAFARFKADAADFTLGNAQAMMWLAQLAYETDDPQKIKRILGRFGLSFLDL